MILYEVLNERPDVLAERTYAVWPDLEALMREHGVPQFTVDGHRPVARSTCSASPSPPSSATRTCSTALDLAGIPLHAADRDETHPIVVAGGHAAFNPEPIADFVDGAVLGDGEQAVLRHHRRRPRPGRPRAAPAAATSCWPGSPRPAASTSRASTTSSTCPTAASQRVAPQPPRRPVAGRQAHRHGPRRVAVPEAAAGAARRDRARADERGDLPRLHPRLPVLPGRA